MNKEKMKKSRMKKAGIDVNDGDEDLEPTPAKRARNSRYSSSY